MTHRVGNIFYIQEENKQQCDFCGKIEELRPYGPNGECICFACGMKDEAATLRQFKARLNGEHRIDSALGEGGKEISK